MKIRIKGNTIRLRLTKSEVDYFANTLFIEEKTEFGKSNFSYALHANESKEVSATFIDQRICVNIPEKLAKDWISTSLVGMNGEMEVGDGRKLYILIEKDFKCLDETVEDQSDNYDNPLAQ